MELEVAYKNLSGLTTVAPWNLLTIHYATFMRGDHFHWFTGQVLDIQSQQLNQLTCQIHPY